jgi:hypothetical protein
MSKSSSKPEASTASSATPEADKVETPNTAAPKKARTPSVKYTNVVQSAYKPDDNPDAMHPLDKPAITSRGGLKFPGVEFVTTPLGIYVDIPARQTRVINPTIRQLLKVLDDLYAK